MAKIVRNNSSIEYTMSFAQADDWVLGNQAAKGVEEEIAEEMDSALSAGLTVVVLDDQGGYAFTLTRRMK